jgi:hypothetical protein
LITKRFPLSGAPTTEVLVGTAAALVTLVLEMTEDVEVVLNVEVVLYVDVVVSDVVGVGVGVVEVVE